MPENPIDQAKIDSILTKINDLTDKFGYVNNFGTSDDATIVLALIRYLEVSTAAV